MLFHKTVELRFTRMIAWAGVERLHAGMTDPLDVPARARWPLDAHAKPMPFAGKKA